LRTKVLSKNLRKDKVCSALAFKEKERLKNHEKQRIKLARLYEKLTCQRNDFPHKLSRFYADNYDVVCVEDLNIKGMVKNHNLAQKILDASWGRFLQLLEFKAASAGTLVVKVHPRGTSEGLSYEDPLRDWISACRILMRGWGSPDSPAETKPLRELIYVPASIIVEAGSPQASAVGSSPVELGFSY